MWELRTLSILWRGVWREESVERRLHVNSYQLPPERKVARMIAELLPAGGGRFANGTVRTYVVRRPSLAAISRAVATQKVSIAQAETPWRSETSGLQGLIGSSAFRRKRELRSKRGLCIWVWSAWANVRLAVGGKAWRPKFSTKPGESDRLARSALAQSDREPARCRCAVS